MSHQCTVVGSPQIEEDAVVLRVVVQHTEDETSGPVFVCRLKAFSDMTIEEYPKGYTPNPEGEYRAEATQTAQKYIDENVAEIEELLEELARRQASGED